MADRTIVLATNGRHAVRGLSVANRSEFTAFQEIDDDLTYVVDMSAYLDGSTISSVTRKASGPTISGASNTTSRLTQRLKGFGDVDFKVTTSAGDIEEFRITIQPRASNAFFLTRTAPAPDPRQFFATVAEAAASQPDATVSYIWVSGTTTAGDGADAVYRRVTGTPVYATTFTCANGVVFEKVPTTGIGNGDYGDITVSGAGTTWTIDPQAVTYGKIQNVSATDRLLGRSTAGAGSVEEITCTAFGRSLIDDADNTAARTTLGLGTAATANTGTSGSSLPFLNTGNTWSGSQTFNQQSIMDISASGSPFAASLLVNLTDNTASPGPYITLRRSQTTGAANNRLGIFNFQGTDSIGTVSTIYAQLSAIIVSATDGAESGAFQMLTTQAGTTANRMTVQNGVYVGSPTGLDMGANTFNVTTLYEAGTSLAAKYGRLGTANTWSAVNTFNADATILNTVTPTSTDSIGFRGTPVNTQNAAYTLALADSGKVIYHDEITARIWTIPANASVAFPIGTTIMLDNTGNSGGTPGAITLQITTDTLRRGDGTAGTGQRTINPNQVACIRKTKATEWVITGAFL